MQECLKKKRRYKNKWGGTMAKLFLVGDFESDNGPGTANKQILQSLTNAHCVRLSKAKSKEGRVREVLFNSIFADAIVICSKSQLNYMVVKVAKKLHKKIFYVMHGCSSFEKKINDPLINDDEINKLKSYEKFIVENTDKTICVSKYFMDFMKHRMPKCETKFDYIFNCVDIKKILHNRIENISRREQIVSIGGGLKEKNILTIAEASLDFNKKIPVKVIGADDVDSARIKSLPNTEWLGLISHEDVFQVLSESRIYVQNSTFETFGLAAIEALYCGCDLLISDRMGCKDLFSNLTEYDVIKNVKDKDEISQKLQYLYNHGNNQRLMNGFKKEYVSHEWQLERFNEIFKEFGIK